MSVIEKLDSVLARASDTLYDLGAPLNAEEVNEARNAIRQAMIDAERFKAYRDATFDGNAVYAALDDRAKARTSADNVADVLDALNRVARLASDSEGGE